MQMFNRFEKVYCTEKKNFTSYLGKSNKKRMFVFCLARHKLKLTKKGILPSLMSLLTACLRVSALRLKFSSVGSFLTVTDPSIPERGTDELAC